MLAARSDSVHVFSLENLPPLHTAIGIILFLCSSVIQHQAHAHLASLHTYVIPTHPTFKYVLCPHYTAEIGIYLGLSIAGAPLNAPAHGTWTREITAKEGDGWTRINWTILSAAFFVAMNLGITAKGTRAWYNSKFGVQNVGPRWGMIPYAV
jgi:3-oxo-5-alpha-steroid 4-dehydrogenase 3 / polyprenol reductase